MTHPNVGAILALDYGYEAVTNDMLRDYMTEQRYPLGDVIHQFVRLSGSFESDLQQATNVVSGWLNRVNEMTRTDEPLSELKIALQCGGSDAFSGVSGNPLAAWVAKEIIQYGGCANLAETDELIGAETYALDKVRDAAVAHKFLSFIERFKERVGWHGHSADGNPSGGNKYRGLYNIYLKSLGAAAKRHPDVPLDAVIDYSERMQSGGFYFMDSPGNDLESIAGQVASGCNMIFFVTGNGSITNFTFVPTIKIVTTTERYQLLSHEMDVNAGAYLDGTPLDELGRATLDLTVDVASGQLSVGEIAGHAQVQIWRDWMQSQSANLNRLQTLEYGGAPIPINSEIDVPDVRLPVYRNGDKFTTDQVGLILPTSLCSGQIARMCVEQLNKRYAGQDNGLSRFVTLVHTEGCGGSINNEFRDSLLGYLAHPFVKHALLLEHGCEITHNAYFRQALLNRNLNPQDFGWASIQLDGGIQNVLHKMIDWFNHQLDNDPVPETATVGLESVRLALTTQGEVTDNIAHAFADLTQMIIAAGGVVVISEQDNLLDSPYVDRLLIADKLHPSLNYGDTISQPGFHIMATPTRDWGEILTGLGATGVEIIVSAVHDQSLSGHPMIPVLQVTDNNLLPQHLRGEIDVFLSNVHLEASRQLLESIVRTASHDYTPKLTLSGNVNFQITRGLLGVSL
jgi:altronate dehydratase